MPPIDFPQYGFCYHSDNDIFVIEINHFDRVWDFLCNFLGGMFVWELE
jgi:hypothetical protein